MNSSAFIFYVLVSVTGGPGHVEYVDDFMSKNGCETFKRDLIRLQKEENSVNTSYMNLACVPKASTERVPPLQRRS